MFVVAARSSLEASRRYMDPVPRTVTGSGPLDPRAFGQPGCDIRGERAGSESESRSRASDSQSAESARPDRGGARSISEAPGGAEVELRVYSRCETCRPAA